MDNPQKYQVLAVISPYETIHQECSYLKKTLSALVQLGTLDLDNHYLADCVTLQNSPSWFAWNPKIVDDFPIFVLVIPFLPPKFTF